MAKKKKQKKVPKNPKWELFCRYYTNNRELFGNATHAYAETFQYKLDTLSHDDAVYETVRDEDENGNLSTTRGKIIKPSSYDKAVNVCAVEGARLLRNPKVNDRINELLKDLFKEEIVDAETSWLIMQRTELAPKVAAIKEFNALNSRVKKRIELTGPNGTPFDEDTRNKSKKAVREFLSRRNS